MASGATHRSVLALVAVLTVVVLVLTASEQIFDSNLCFLSPATALLAGDHPYRDFFESGAPLAAYLSAGAQLAVGYRLIGEFLLHWLFIVPGVVIAFYLGLQLSGSIRASLVMTAIPLVLLARTPTYHYAKLFFFPLTIWLAWRYIDNPDMRRGAALGATAAVAFLFRPDYGVYIGFASVMAFALARVAVPASRRLGWMVSDAAVYAAAVAVVLAPWAIVVQVNEGLAEYAETRAGLFQTRGHHVAYGALLDLNPLRPLTPDPAPAPTPAVVGFFWKDGVQEDLRRRLERQHGLRLLDDRDPRGRWRYEVSNLYDMSLFNLDPYISDGVGFEWDRLQDIRWRIPGQHNVVRWLEQMALLVPVFLVAAGAWEAWRSRSVAAWRMILAGTFLAAIDSALFREHTYFVTVAPVTAALSARFLVGKTALCRGCAVAALLLTGVAAVVWARETPLVQPSRLVESVPSTFRQLLASPPDGGSVSLRYVRDCTAPGDRVLVTGVTPFDVSYFAQRPIAGGHLYWRSGWRSDPAHEAQSLALLRKQSVPIAYSTHSPVLEDFAKYPGIHDYLAEHYVALEGTNGRILVDTRRQPTGRFAATGFPCFR